MKKRVSKFASDFLETVPFEDMTDTAIGIESALTRSAGLVVPPGKATPEPTPSVLQYFLDIDTVRVWKLNIETRVYTEIFTRAVEPRAGARLQIIEQGGDILGVWYDGKYLGPVFPNGVTH